MLTNTSLRNGGDAAIVDSMELVVRRLYGDDVTIWIEDIDPTWSIRAWPERNIVGYPLGARSVHRRRWRRGAARFYRALLVWALCLMPCAIGRRGAARLAWLRHRYHCDLVLSAGGTYVTNRYPVVDKLVNVLLAQRHGIPTAFFMQSVEYLDRAFPRALLRLVGNRSAIFLARDKATVANLQSMGVDEARIHQAADGAFLLGDARFTADRDLQSSTIAVSVRDCSMFHAEGGDERATRTATATLLDELVDRTGMGLLFVSTCQGVPGYQYDDAAVARTIVDLMREDTRALITIDSAFHSPAEFRETVRSARLMVSFRMHAAIQALNVGVPVIPVVYELKTSELWEAFGLGESVISIDDDAQRMMAVAARILGGLSTYQEALEAGRRAARRSAQDGVDALRTAVLR